MARGRGVGPRPAPPHAPAHFKRVWGVLSLSVLLWLAAPAAAQTPAAAGNGKAASPAATLPAGKNITVPSHVRKHPDPAPLSIPEGSTLEDCIKHPGLCQPMACELWRDDIKDRCRYVQEKDACGSDDHLIHYLELFYCLAGGRIRLLVAALFVVWMLLLFYGMSIVAEVFLCPAVEYISELLRLSPDIAGVTLLAFASGAPDIFTELAAIDGGKAVEVELAVASVVGSGLFICSVSLAAVIFVRPVEIKDRVAFVRDILAYLVTCAVTLQLLWNASFSAREAALLIVMYVVYLMICIYTSRGNTTMVHRATHQALPIGSPRRSGTGDGGSASKLRERSVELARWSAPAALNLAATASSVVRSPVSRGPSVSSARGYNALFSDQPFSHTNGTYSRPSSPNGGGGGPSRTSSPVAVAVDAWEESKIPRLSISSELGADEWDLLESPPDNPPRGSPALDALAAWPLKAWEAAQAAARERIHFGSNPVMNACVLATSPLVLLMHATMPALDDGRCSRRHCAVLAMLAPLFLLLVAGAPALGVLPFLALFILLAGLLYGTMYASFLHSCRLGIGFLPKANAVFAVIAFVQSAVWLSQIADEVVALFQAIGNIFSVEDDLLGATVLAWGETVPDLMAMIAVARAGQSTMAVAACFGGPVLNLLIGTGVPVLVKNVKTGSLPFRLSNGIIILFGCTMVLLLVLLIAVPLSGWRLSKGAAFALIAVYCAFQVLFLLAEEDFLFTTPFNHKAVAHQ